MYRSFFSNLWVNMLVQNRSYGLREKLSRMHSDTTETEEKLALFVKIERFFIFSESIFFTIMMFFSVILHILNLSVSHLSMSHIYFLHAVCVDQPSTGCTVKLRSILSMKFIKDRKPCTCPYVETCRSCEAGQTFNVIMHRLTLEKGVYYMIFVLLGQCSKHPCAKQLTLLLSLLQTY